MVYDNFLENLNEEQKKAILCNNGPLFVVAGAGTGKTKTLTNKVAYLYKNGIDPSNMLILTFTNKAAKEMQQRINTLLGFDVLFTNMSTFHSFAFRFLKENIKKLNLAITEDFSVADESDSKKIIKDILLDMLDVKKDANTIYKEISAYKIKNIKPVDFEVFDKVYNLYEKTLEKDNLIDFDNLLLFTKKLLKENSDLLNYYSNKFTHILVDEFQDTDKVQYEILKLLVNNNLKKNIFVVGDPDQSIYSFRGARYENNDEFIKDFNPQIITLNQNYRSTENILECANNLISYNEGRSIMCKDKLLHSNRGKGNNVIYQYYERYTDEALLVIRHIKYLLNVEKIKPNEIAILIRSNYLSRVYEEALIKENIPYVIYGGTSFFQRKEIKDIIAYLKLIVNKDQDYYLKRIINIPKRQIGKKILDSLDEIIKNEYEKKNDISYFQAIDFIEKGKTKEKLLSFKNLIIDIKEKFETFTKPFDAINYLVEKIEYDKYLETLEESKKQEKINTIDQLSSNVEEVYQTDKYKDCKNVLEVFKIFLEDIELLSDFDNKTSSGKVILSTFHQVKGLEFDTVIMPAMEEQIIPNAIILKNAEEDIEEERRIAYVGITRAKNRLIMSYAKNRWRFGKWNEKEASRFLNETKRAKTEKLQNINNSKKSKPNIRKDALENKRVWHPKFGKGQIVEISDSDIITILFENNVGIKKISLSFPGLEIFF